MCILFVPNNIYTSILKTLFSLRPIYILGIVRVFFQRVLLRALEAALVRTNYKLFVRAKSTSNGCKGTLWKKKRVQVSDLYDNNWQLF